MNPNHPHYAGLGGGGPSTNLLDNMLMAAGFQATEQPVLSRPAIVPQYSYAQDVSSMQHHALNLGQTHTTTMAGADPVHVIVYQQQQNEQHQQQPISYKIPQLGTVVSQEQNFVVNDQGGQLRQNHTPVSSHQALTEAEQIVQSTGGQTLSRQIQSPAERRKDIVAQAMQEQKIFEDSVPKQEPIVKQEPGVSNANASQSTTTTTEQAAVSTATASTSVDTKPVVTATKTTPTTTPQQRRPYQRSANYNRQQVMPRLQILDDEDDGLTCRMCLASYWYKAELLDHLKTVHSINEPDKYEKEEREKKMRRMREEQQRIIMAKKQREERERRLREVKYGRGRGVRLPGGLRSSGPGQRPSFQYRDGAFICDLCKEKFSDGNDMVTHWKSHVKKQQADMMRTGRGRGRGRPPGMGRGRGRPSLDKEASSDSSEDSDGGKKKKKGMPRWTAYLLWSTRKRREVVVDHPDWTFAEIAKWISEEWKKVDADEKDELQKEAEEMNELGIRKLPRDDDGPDPDKDTTDEDSDFEEGYRKKSKPIMLKIKKEKGGAAAGSSDESDWEPEAEIKPPTRESTRSGRQRKRPSFFQEFESQENNLDTILEQFEKQQAEEFGKPRPPKVEKPEAEKKPRKPRKRKEQPEFDASKILEEEVEVEVLRSGRKRKVRRVMTTFGEGSDEDDKMDDLGGASSDDEDFEPPPEDEVEKIEEHDDQLEDEEEVDSEDLEDEEDEDDLRYGDMDLPPKKRGRPKKLLTDEEIEEATRTAMKTKPALDIIPVIKEAESKENGEEKGEKEKESKEGEEGEGEEKSEKSAEGGEENTGDGEDASESNQDDGDKSDSEKVKPPWVKETLTDSEDEESKTKEPESLGTPAPLESIDTPAPMESLDSTAPPLDTPAPLESIDTPAPPDLPEHDHHNNDHSEMNTDTAFTDAAATVAEVDSVVTHMDTMEQQHDQLDNVAVTQFENTLDKSEVPLSSVADGMGDDLLGDAGHNLDASQLQADSLEANLEDIFK